jgi:hypothetical protein
MGRAFCRVGYNRKVANEGLPVANAKFIGHSWVSILTFSITTADDMAPSLREASYSR